MGKELDQQGVVQLRPSDHICVIQNGTEKRLLMQSLIDWVLFMIGNPIKVFFNGTQVPKPLAWRANGNLASGAAAFSMVDADGNAIFTAIHSVNIVMNNASQVYATGWSVSGDMKTLTVTVNQLLLSALVLIYSNPPNGTTVRVEVIGS